MVPPRRIISKLLGEILVERGVITNTQLQEAMKVQKERGGLIGQILVNLGYADEEAIVQAFTTQYGFPYLPLRNYEIDPVIIKLIPQSVAKQYCLVPVDKIGNSLSITMADPTNTKAIEDIEFITKCKVQTFVSTVTDVKQALEKYYG